MKASELRKITEENATKLHQDISSFLGYCHKAALQGKNFCEREFQIFEESDCDNVTKFIDAIHEYDEEFQIETKTLTLLHKNKIVIKVSW